MLLTMMDPTYEETNGIVSCINLTSIIKVASDKQIVA